MSSTHGAVLESSPNSVIHNNQYKLVTLPQNSILLPSAPQFNIVSLTIKIPRIRWCNKYSEIEYQTPEWKKKKGAALKGYVRKKGPDFAGTRDRANSIEMNNFLGTRGL